MAYQHQPSARDAGLARVAAATIVLSVLGIGTTAGISAVIAAATPAPAAKKPGTDYTKPKTQPRPQPGKSSGTVAPAADKPESSSGDEDTSSGGS